MPSPFPGMDPYLEAPDRWANFHNGLAAEIQTQLNATLPDPFVAVAESYEEILLHPSDDRTSLFKPDVAIERRSAVTKVAFPQDASLQAVALAELEESPYLELDPVRLTSVAIYHHNDFSEVVCAIEILSPSNKQTGSSRMKYERKRNAILMSEAGLIEIDLLRTGQPLCDDVTTPTEPYVTLVSLVREDRGRQDRFYRTGLSTPLPVVAVPLGPTVEHALLDLQSAFEKTYESRGYRRGLVDYSQPPTPPLTEPLTPIAATVLRESRRHSANG